MTMSAVPQKRTMITACMRCDGSPAFAITNFCVTPEEMAEGVHYTLADAQLLQNGYEEPFVHFDQDEMTAFLHPALRQYLGLPADDSDLTKPLIVEKHR
jgi:hypothetical protein